MSSVIDTSLIRPHIIQPTQLIQLAFPEKGLIHLRVLASDEVPYLYPDLTAIQPGDTDVSTPQRLGISEFSIENAIEVTKDLHLYQLFYGVSPGIIRARVGYPVGSLAQGLDVRGNQISGDFGYVDGFRSPLNKPSPMSENIIPPDFDIGYVFHNPDTIPIKPMMYWHVVTMRVGVIRNADLVYNIMAGKFRPEYVARKSLGGIIPFSYHAADTWGVDFIDYDTIDTVDIAETTNDPEYKASAMSSIRKSLRLGSEQREPPIEVPPLY